MFKGWNGLEGTDFSNVDQQYDTSIDQQFDTINGDSYDVIDTNYVSISNEVGYQDGWFGNDPLSQSRSYQCPQFPGLTYVDSYVRSDGTLVNAHWRTNPDGFVCNNLSANK